MTLKVSVNVSSTLTNQVFGLWLHCVSLWTYGWTDGRTDIFTGFIRSPLRRWPKNILSEIAQVEVGLQKRTLVAQLELDDHPEVQYSVTVRNFTMTDCNKTYTVIHDEAWVNAGAVIRKNIWGREDRPVIWETTTAKRNYHRTICY